MPLVNIQQITNSVIQLRKSIDDFYIIISIIIITYFNIPYVIYREILLAALHTI